MQARPTVISRHAIVPSGDHWSQFSRDHQGIPRSNMMTVVVVCHIPASFPIRDKNLRTSEYILRNRLTESKYPDRAGFRPRSRAPDW